MDGDWDAGFTSLAGRLPKLKDVYLEGGLVAASGQYYVFEGQLESLRPGMPRERWTSSFREGGRLPKKPKTLPSGWDPETAGAWNWFFAAEHAQDVSDSASSDSEPTTFAFESSRRDPDRHSGFTFWNPDTGSDLDDDHNERSIDPDELLETSEDDNDDGDDDDDDDDDDDANDRNSGFTFW